MIFDFDDLVPGDQFPYRMAMAINGYSPTNTDMNNLPSVRQPQCNRNSDQNKDRIGVESQVECEPVEPEVSQPCANVERPPRGRWAGDTFGIHLCLSCSSKGPSSPGSKLLDAPRNTVDTLFCEGCDQS